MNQNNDKFLNFGIANAEIEGLYVDDEMREWCKQLLNEEITYEEYISLLKERGKKQ